jgi:hypothetical protein
VTESTSTPGGLGELVMDDTTSFRLDATAVRAGVSGFEPLIAELGAIVQELDVVADDLRQQCAAHHSGALFDVGHRRVADSTSAAVEWLHGAVTAHLENVHRACAELQSADRETRIGDVMDGRW